MMANALISGYAKVYTTGYDILVGANAILTPRIPQNMLMTCVLLRWDDTDEKMYMTGAGHEHVLIYRKNTDTVEKIKTGGI
jgi:serine phosphatase RsbU (regulator of sigma subunit)